MDFDLSQIEDFTAAREFVEAFHQSSNFPYAYAYATFLTLSGAVLGRSVSLWHRVDYFPNFYTCLVGPSGTNRKSTIMGYGVKSLPESMEVQNTLSTWGGMLRTMSETGGNLIVNLDELATVLNTSKKDYAKELVNKLTEWYSCPDKDGNYVKTEKNRLVVRDIFVSILSASTIEWIQATLSMGDILGGFGNRMTWVLGDPRLENSNPVPPLRFDWATLLRVSPRQLYFTAEARDTYSAYEDAFYQEQGAFPPVQRVLGERLPEKVLKTALIRAVWDGRDSIEEYTVIEGIKWGRYLQRCVELLAPQFETPDRRIMAAISGGVRSKRALTRQFGHVYSNKIMKEVIDGLRWEGTIQINGDQITLL